jgi:hypothetical protein
VENVQGKAIVQTIARFSKFVDSGNRSRVASFTQPKTQHSLIGWGGSFNPKL